MAARTDRKITRSLMVQYATKWVILLGEACTATIELIESLDLVIEVVVKSLDGERFGEGINDDVSVLVDSYQKFTVILSVFES